MAALFGVLMALNAMALFFLMAIKDDTGPRKSLSICVPLFAAAVLFLVPVSIPLPHNIVELPYVAGFALIIVFFNKFERHIKIVGPARIAAYRASRAERRAQRQRDSTRSSRRHTHA